MATLEALRRTIHSTESLQSVVTTMKALAVVSMRQYERAVSALAGYTATIELGLQALLRDRPPAARTPPPQQIRLGGIVFGSDYGMVGQFNEQIAAHALDALQELQVPPAQCRMIVVGERVAGRLEDGGLAIERLLHVPGSLAGVTPLVQELLVQIEAWRGEWGLNRLALWHNASAARGGSHPVTLQLLPLDAGWLGELASRPWPERGLPTYSMSWDRLFSALIAQHLFISIYRACAESLAAENASRLAAMQGAEQNIEERLAELTGAFHRLRQSTITEELLDIVAGSEALAKPSR